MATITTAVYLDGGTARTAGEAMTINGGRLVVRTDTRWHANAPASMTGSLGNAAISSALGGGYEIDGTQVRWLAISGGSGTAAIGTTVTQGGVSGYFLGYWASLTAAPSTTLGATGYIKLREVTGGNFAAGALSGISATADGPDVVGWIEVVHDQATAITVPRLGDFKVRGDWFDLGVTTGAANQLVQCPTNGSATCYVPGVWIETATADEYEFIPAIFAALMIPANLGTDARSKFVCMETNGQIRIGHNGTADVGYVWPVGRKIRIANVFGRQCLTTTRGTSAIPNSGLTNRPEFLTTSAGKIDIAHFATDWYLNLAQPYSVDIHHSCTFDAIYISECASGVNLSDGGSGLSQNISYRPLDIVSCRSGGAITDWNCHRLRTGASENAVVKFSFCSGQVVTRLKCGQVDYLRAGVAISLYLSNDITLLDCSVYNHGVKLFASIGCTLDGIDYCDRYVGETTTVNPVYAVTVSDATDSCTVRNVTFGHKGEIANTHPYYGIFTVYTSSNIKLRECGSRSAMLNGGSANQPAYSYVSGGNNANISLQRIYMTPTRAGAIITTNSDKGTLYEHVYGDFADTMTITDLNATVRNCGGTNTTTGQASVYGTHFWDVFVSDTVGRIVLSLNEPTPETAAYYTAVSGNPKFTSAGNLGLATVGDEAIIEQPYFVKGVTLLSNTAPIVTGANVTYSANARWGNHDIYFQYDKGAGWNGTWLDLTAANLTGAGAIDPAVGVKLKYRMVCAVANTGNLLTYIRVQTTSTLAAQVANLYPLDTITLTLSGLVSGSDVTILAAGTETVLDTKEENSGTTYAYTYETPQTIDIAVYQPGYIPFYIRNYSLGSSNASLPCAQVADVSYLT